MKHIIGETSPGSFPIAIVVSQFNQEVTNALLDAALSRLRERGFQTHDILVVEVPGAVEIPLVVQKIAQFDNYCAIVALGAVIRGETTHYDYVCKQVSDGCARIALEYDVPVVFGVLTTEDEEQAMARAPEKGSAAVDCAVDMVTVMQQLVEEMS